jgi:hypothetical protein
MCHVMIDYRPCFGVSLFAVPVRAGVCVFSIKLLVHDSTTDCLKRRYLAIVQEEYLFKANFFFTKNHRRKQFKWYTNLLISVYVRFVLLLTGQVSLVKQQLLAPGALRIRDHIAQSLVLCVVFCRSLFVISNYCIVCSLNYVF